MTIIKIGNYFYSGETLIKKNKKSEIYKYEKITIYPKKYIEYINENYNDDNKYIIIKKNNNYKLGKNELDNLKLLENEKGIIKCLGYYTNNFYIKLAFKYYDNGSLKTYMKCNTLNKYQYENIFIKLIEILKKLENRNLMHGDIKEDNILINDQLEPEICDLESLHHIETKTKIFTEKYFNSNYYNEDIYALYIMYFHIKNKKYPDEENIPLNNEKYNYENIKKLLIF